MKSELKENVMETYKILTGVEKVKKEWKEGR